MIAALTGHRPDKLPGGYDHDSVGRATIRYLLRSFFVRRRIEKVVSGMALGFDQDGAEVALELGLHLCCAVPCDEQDRMWPQESRTVYQRMLASAAEVVIVSPGPYAAWKMQTRNVYMVDRAAAAHGWLVAAHESGTPGGTQNCLAYADTKPLLNRHNIWPELQELLRR